MPVRVFLDTNVFIHAFEFQGSNSALLLEMLNRGEVEVVVSELVVLEMMRYFKKYYSKDLASKFREYLLQSCVVVFKDEVADTMDRYWGKIKEKDLEHLAVVRSMGLKFLISTDEDFRGHEEYHTPRDFLKAVGRKPKRTEY